MQKRKLTKDAALKLVLEKYDWIFDHSDDVEYDRRPCAAGQVEVGSQFEFRAKKPFNKDGERMMKKGFIVEESTHRIHPFGKMRPSRVLRDIRGDLLY